MVYTIFAVLFFIGALMFGAGLLGRLGTNGLNDISANVATSFALIFTYSFLLLHFSSFSGLAQAFEAICGGVPYLDEIIDFGSMKAVFTNAPLRAATSFFDVVVLSASIDIISLLPLTQGPILAEKKPTRLWVEIFTGIIVSLVSLFILNRFIKSTQAYNWVVSIIGGLISLISLGTLPAAIISLFKSNVSGSVWVVGFFAVFSKSKVAGIIRDSFFKAVVYVIGIFILEKYFGSIAAGVSVFTNLLVAFGPCIIVIIGIIICLKAVF